MATIAASLSSKADASGRSQILLRVTVSRERRFRVKSGLYISPDRFKGGKVSYPRGVTPEREELAQIEDKLKELTEFIYKLCRDTPAEKLTKEFIAAEIDKRQHPDKYISELQRQEDGRGFFKLWDAYIAEKRENPNGKDYIGDWRLKRYDVLRRSLARYEAYKRISSPDYALNVQTITADDVAEYEHFLTHEGEVHKTHPELYLRFPLDSRGPSKDREPKPRGNNTIAALFSCFRAFLNWCVKNGHTLQRPFDGYLGTSREKYGDPYFITMEERDAIAAADLSQWPELEAQRDIFIFHCFVGCRVSDLIKLTDDNVADGALQYIPQKTSRERQRVVRVPLLDAPLALIEKRRGQDPAGRLFPFITPQRYNDAIKSIFTKCGITRKVIVRDPLTGEDTPRAINEIASSHIARRTFVGNLYAQVQDPNIICKLSGHVEGSKAFARYRNINDSILRGVMNKLGGSGYNDN